MNPASKMAHRSGTETVAALPPSVEQKLQGHGGIVGDYGPIIVREQRSVVWPSEKLIAGLNGNGVLLWFELDDFDSAVARAEVMKAVKARHRNPPSGDDGPNHWEGRSRNPQYAECLGNAWLVEAATGSGSCGPGRLWAVPAFEAGFEGDARSACPSGTPATGRQTLMTPVRSERANTRADVFAEFRGPRSGLRALVQQRGSGCIIERQRFGARATERSCRSIDPA